MNYFKITGLENGEPIEPYGVETDASYPEISVGRNYDSARYYEPISKEEYEELIRNERNGDEKMKKLKKIIFDLDLVIDSLRDLGKDYNKVVYDLECVLDYLIEKSGEKL